METSETRRGRADAGLETWSVGSARETWAAPALLRLLVIAVGGYLYGYVTARLPAPDTGARFWLGNLAAPYLLIPFLAGAWRFRAVAASAAGRAGRRRCRRGLLRLPVGGRRDQPRPGSNVLIWAHEFVIGIAALVWVWRNGRPAPGRDRP